VDSDLVQGTLRQGFSLYKSLEHPFARALLIMFLVAEVHPFDDGNGRTARAMMNSELVSAEETRIIIPSVFRNEYVASLKRLTNHLQPESFVRVMSFAHEFTATISFDNYGAARLLMEECHAFDDPADDKKLRIPKKP
jgi:Fic family protein